MNDSSITYEESSESTVLHSEVLAFRDWTTSSFGAVYYSLYINNEIKIT